MAESAVKSAADWLGALLVEEGKYLLGATQKVEELRDELLWLQCFLRDADTIQCDDEIVRLWVLQIKEYVSEAEDIIDDFVIKVVSRRRRRNNWINKLKRYSLICREWYALHKAASGIDSLKIKISTLSPRLRDYGLQTSYSLKTYRAREARNEQVQQRLKYFHIEEEKIVGLEKDAAEIVAALLQDSERTNGVVAIHGMGGLGKTTLAAKVYQHKEIIQHFRCRAWAYVSKQYQLRGVLQKVVTDLSHKSTNDLSEMDLVAELLVLLRQKRCLVVLDDVWSKEAWGALRSAFTFCGGDSGSKVLITTRKEEVAKDADPKALGKPDILGTDESWELLEKTLGRVQTNIDIGEARADENETEVRRSDGDNSTDTVREEESKKNNLGKEMLNYCKGLPLAIVVLGGILRNKDTLDEWKTVHKNISSYLRRGYDHGRSYMEVLVQSYNDLPYHLKPCFLHLANFPEDYEIYTERLYWMWMAEGLVTWSRDRIAGTESLEDVANEYLSDLVQAGMVQIVQQTSDGRIKSIRVHDLMRDVSLQKATAENFLNIIDHRQYPEKPLNISSYFSHSRLHRMAIYPTNDVESFIPDSLSTSAHKHLRSLLFITGEYEVGKDKHQEWMKHICTEFQWLRVLDLERLCLQGGLDNQIKNLVHLRYLSLKETKVSKVPPCIGNLRFLQILDLRISCTVASVRLPNTLWKLGELRHLLLPSKSYQIVGSKMLRVDTLICLEGLENLMAGTFKPEELVKLKNLRRLSVKETMSKECLDIIRHSPALTSGCLKSFSFHVKGEVLSDKPPIFLGLDFTHRLTIVGQITTCIENVVFPRSLRALSLESCELEDDPMGVLGSLSHLKDLKLGTISFSGREITCNARSFLKLEMLHLQGLMSLEKWVLENGSMSKLMKLTIKQCAKLENIPESLPSSVYLTCSPCVRGIEKYGTCIFHKTLSFPVASYPSNFMEASDDPTSLLEARLMDDKCKKVILCGQGGLGRSVNLKVLYHRGAIHQHFHAIAWACPTRSCVPGGFLRRMLQGLLKDLNPEMLPTKNLSLMSSSEMIGDILTAMQQKKCLVILLNVEGIDDHLRYLDQTFGSEAFVNGSKLLITTSDNMPTTTDNNEVSILHLKPPKDGSLSFLKKRLITASENKGSLATKLEGLRSVAHPLSLVMLGGLLAMKDTLREQEAIDCSKMKGLPQIFGFCYSDLPLHLRHCLMFLSNFPTDTQITTKKLYQMWIASGFVELEHGTTSSDQKIGMVLEVITESYLAELVQRGMVKVGKRGPTGKIKTCRLQFALQNVCLKKAREEHFLTVVDLSERLASDGDFAHLAIHLNENIPSSDQRLHDLISSLKSLSSLSSLLFSPNVDDPRHNKGGWVWFTEICNHFQSLKVLDLEGMWMTEGSLPEEVGNLGNLRYLSLKETWISKLPSSIEKLTKLQTLDLRVLVPLVIPDVLFKLECLRHLYFPDKIASLPAKLQLLGLDHLRALDNLDTDKVHLDHLPKLKLVKKISIRKIHEVTELDAILGSLSRSLDLTVNSKIINAKENILSEFQNLHKLKIKGKISDPLRPEMFPAHLKELTLKHTQLVRDPIPALAKLPNLRSLYFDHESFLGKKITFSADFDALTHLTFYSLINLEHLECQKNGMSNLVCTVIRECWRLKEKDVNLPIKDLEQRIIEI